MGGRRDDSIQPGLLVFSARGCERGARNLFRVQAKRRSLGSILCDWQRPFYCFRPVQREQVSERLVTRGLTHDMSQSHDGRCISPAC